MVKPKRRVYVVPDVKQYGAVEQVTQALIEAGSGDFLSEILQEHGIPVPDSKCYFFCVS